MGAETQFDWVELPNPLAAWNVGKHAHLLVGALAYSGRWRGVLTEAEDFPRLVDTAGSRSTSAPSRRGNRKGVVEKANHSAVQRWWRTLSDNATVAAAQSSLDAPCVRLDERTRVRDDQRRTVAELAAQEPLRPAPLVAFPADLVEQRTSARRASCPSAATPTRCHPAWSARA